MWRGILEQQLIEIKKLPDGDDSLVKKLTATVGRAAAMFQGGGLKKDSGDKILVRFISIHKLLALKLRNIDLRG